MLSARKSSRRSTLIFFGRPHHLFAKFLTQSQGRMSKKYVPTFSQHSIHWSQISAGPGRPGVRGAPYPTSWVPPSAPFPPLTQGKYECSPIVLKLNTGGLRIVDILSSTSFALRQLQLKSNSEVICRCSGA